jgi:hypothetical protein
MRIRRDEAFEVFSQTGITRVDVSAAHATRQKHRIDLRDEAQQVVVRVAPPELPILLLSLLVKVRGATDPEALLLRTVAKIETDDDADIVQIVALHRVDRAHLLEFATGHLYYLSDVSNTNRRGSLKTEEPGYPILFVHGPPMFDLVLFQLTSY